MTFANFVPAAKVAGRQSAPKGQDCVRFRHQPNWTVGLDVLPGMAPKRHHINSIDRPCGMLTGEAVDHCSPRTAQLPSLNRRPPLDQLANRGDTSTQHKNIARLA